MTCSKAIVTDLDSLKAAVGRIQGLTWCENKKNFEWYGHWVNDYSKEDAAYKNGIDVEQYGKCDHAIKVSGCNYEIGVVPRKDGQGWSLVWDFFGTGKNINKVVGDSAEKLMCAYAEEVAERYAAENSYMLYRSTDEDGSIILEMCQY